MTIDFEKSSTNKLFLFVIYLLGDEDKEELRDIAIEAFTHFKNPNESPNNYTNSAVYKFHQDIDLFFYYNKRKNYTSMTNSLIMQYSIYLYQSKNK